MRFYQRLGRLIRSNKEGSQKFLVVTLTPKTPEYDNLDDALRNLYMEGVDVSYILDKDIKKGPVAKVLEVIKNEGNGFLSLEKLQEAETSEVDESEAYFGILNSKVESKESEIARYAEKAIRDGSVLYMYDEERMAKLVSFVLQGKFCTMYSGDRFSEMCDQWLIKAGYMKNIKLERKGLLNRYKTIFLSERREEVLKDLEREIMERRKKYSEVKINVEENFNKSISSFNVTLNLSVNIMGITVFQRVQISFYNFRKKEEWDIGRLNAIAIGYRACEMLLEKVKS
ncbi:hypothetical protein [Acidianus sp. RZ1]|uniref:hypothetical protein n=1 Tax=Acidianus sp. RZ1 TaxID=1540082 RepID=UPI0020A35CF2|nr:hypothetical protein [Acidianus sp. RZ1]